MLLGLQTMFQLLPIQSQIYTTDMSAEQRARSGYEHLIQLPNDEGVIKMLTFLREREVVISNGFGEVLVDIQNYYNHDRYFFMDKE